MAGKYLPNSSNVVGVDLFSNYGKILYDAYIPDVQVGLLYPSLGGRFIWRKDVTVAAGMIGVFGLRGTVEDFVKIDLRPLVGIWVGKKGDIAVSIGLSLDAGITF